MKHVNIEFFDEEPIENFITCLNYRMDKIFFVGFERTMSQEKQNRTRSFLKDICGVDAGSVCFEVVKEDNLEQIKEKIEAILQEEQQKGNLCYIDLTGGEELILTAFGMVGEKYQLPLHRYKVEKNELISFHNKSPYQIETSAPKQNIKLTINDALAMRGGCINAHKQKAYKENVDNEELKKDVMKMWEIVKDHPARWNVFSSIIKDCKKHKNDRNEVELSRKEWNNVIASKNNISQRDVEVYIKELQELSIMKWQLKAGKMVCYSFKNNNIESCILDAGCLLELVTYYDRRSKYPEADVRIGIVLDWDGVIHTQEKDVENEIDVMVLEQYTLRFISCKSGEVSATTLYELDTIAEELGGKYVQKELVTASKISEVLHKRAKQMNIKICNV